MKFSKVFIIVLSLFLLLSSCAAPSAGDKDVFSPDDDAKGEDSASDTKKDEVKDSENDDKDAGKDPGEDDSGKTDVEGTDCPDDKTDTENGGEASDDPPPVTPSGPQTEFILTFAGDCTLGTDFSTYGKPGTFVHTVGENYSYPFLNCLQYFENDDFTMVNLECALTNYNEPADKTYKFRGPPEYAKILVEGNVECVSVANNHSYDYGETGYNDTKAALEAYGVSYAEDGGTLVYETAGGLKIGVFAGWSKIWSVKTGVQSLKDQGADIIIAAMHFGIERDYLPSNLQVSLAHQAIDAGAHIVFGAHPHVLQEIEEYNGGIIYYSLGNFSFGGNRNPVDKDTAIIRQHVSLTEEGAVLGETEIIPYSVSGQTDRNDYQPTPLEEGSAAYNRVLSKLDGSYGDAWAAAKEASEPTENPNTPEVSDTPDVSENPETSDTPDTPDAPDVPSQEGSVGEGTDTPETEDTPLDDDLVLISQYLPNAVIELKYATADNFTGSVIYDFTEPLLRYGTVKKLIAAQAELQSLGYDIKIWDAFRPVSAQKRLWEVFPDSRYVANPETGFSSHSRGNTVDITLMKDGAEVPMPTGFDDFSLLADRDYSDVSDLNAAQNARILEAAMLDAGFKPYSGEWWHFSDTVTYEVVTEY